MTTTNYKEWVQNRAEEIANRQYDCGFYDLGQYLQRVVYNRAMEDHKDHIADQFDNAHDGEKYGKVKL